MHNCTCTVLYLTEFTLSQIWLYHFIHFGREMHCESSVLLPKDTTELEPGPLDMEIPDGFVHMCEAKLAKPVVTNII